MPDNIETHCKPQYKLLSEEQINQIHSASLEILADIGVQISHEEALKLLERNNCIIEENNMVRIPKWVVEECLKSVPSLITIYNKNGEEVMKLGGENIYFGLGTDLIRTIDLETDELRLSLLQDVKNAAIVSDYCQNIDFIASFVPLNIAITFIRFFSFINIIYLMIS